MIQGLKDELEDLLALMLWIIGIGSACALSLYLLFAAVRAAVS